MRDHSHNHMAADSTTSHCTCGKSCMNCSAEELCVSSGCDMEAKQYEYPSTRSARSRLRSRATDGQAGQAHADHMSHMDHEKAMTAPRMAKQMEADMRRRFWISLLLTIPIVLYSPLGESIFEITLPTPIPVNWLLLMLTTPVVLWCGSHFLRSEERPG